ncbi:hypothetical protein UFOVP263_32 [uncultured Caudovirales phage]|uniref:Uncharacterized protein n=1 Tax=uncultured Caudovirales phage TaxID=2100421 RepID=A0A6J5TB15_9CAUD|nr:hypothetical protein UFOVP263_32 [uncultured Caudovirales phage]CAB4242051.1 hypothetical protein UFOVP91_30 [uncultured Caudovirales phage]
MAILFELIAKAGEYTNAKGETKQRWHKCGVAIESKTDAGMSLNIESLPTNFDGWLNLKKPVPRENQGAGTPPQNKGAGNPTDFDAMEDDIPF